MRQARVTELRWLRRRRTRQGWVGPLSLAHGCAKLLRGRHGSLQSALPLPPAPLQSCGWCLAWVPERLWATAEVAAGPSDHTGLAS